MASAFKRFTVPFISITGGAGLEVSGIANIWLAVGIWAVGGLWALGALVSWWPVRTRLSRVRRLRLALAPDALVDDTGLPEWLRELVDGDRTKFSQLVRVRVDHWNQFKGLVSREPIITPFVQIENCSIFPARVVDIEGRMSINDEPCQLDAYCDGLPVSIEHGESRPLGISQPVTAETREALINARSAGNEVEFNLGRLRLRIEPLDPDGLTQAFSIALGQNIKRLID